MISLSKKSGSAKAVPIKQLFELISRDTEQASLPQAEKEEDQYELLPAETGMMYEFLILRLNAGGDEADAILKDLADNPYIVAIYRSGDDLTLFVRVNYTEGSFDNVQKQVSGYLLNDLGITATQSFPPLKERFKVDTDPDLVYNPNAVPLELIDAIDQAEPQWIDVYNEVAAITAQKIKFTPANHSKYIRELADNCNLRGIPLAAAKFQITEQHPHDVDAIYKVIEMAYEDSAHHGIGLTPNKKFESTLAGMKKFLAKHYDFRYDVVKGRTEVKDCKTGSCEFVPMDERLENSIYLHYFEEIGKGSANMMRMLQNSNYVRDYHPFREYFNRLPKWDGQTDYIAQLADTVTVTNQPLWNKWLPKFLAGMLACAVKDNVENHISILFTGLQGIGKSTFLRSLVPKALRSYYYEGTINPADKDALLRLSENILINMDDFESLSKADMGALKQLITAPGVTLRRAFGRYNQTFVRRASFTGSLNLGTFLTDSQNRRFLTLEALAFAKHNVDIDKVMAQAYHLQGQPDYRFWPDKADEIELDAANEPYRSRSPEEELIDHYFRVPAKGEKGDHMTATMVMTQLQQFEPSQRLFASAIGRALKSLKFQYVKTKVYGYMVKRRSDAEIHARYQLIPDPIQQTLELNNNK